MFDDRTFLLASSKLFLLLLLIRLKPPPPPPPPPAFHLLTYDPLEEEPGDGVEVIAETRRGHKARVIGVDGDLVAFFGKQVLPSIAVVVVVMKELEEVEKVMEEEEEEEEEEEGGEVVFSFDT